jgi:maleylacetoacetate isomerase
VLTQSLAIIEYLDETHPNPPVLPHLPADRARVRALALAVACDVHPINNLRVLRYLTDVLGISDEQKSAWYRHWVDLGLTAFEQMLAADPRTGAFCHGDAPGLADCCLVPQVYNARRFQVDLKAMPFIRRIVENCETLPEFRAAAPENCADAEV